MIKNHDPDAWHQELLALQIVSARRDWAANTSLEDDHARARAEVDAKRLEDREQFAITRANEMRAAEEFAAHSKRLDLARAEFDRSRPPSTAAKKEAKAS